MGDTISPSPVLAEGLQNPSALAAVTAGLQQGQQFGAANALKGVDFNDPSSVDNAISGLVRHGAIDQANALGQLNFVQPIRSNPDKAFGKIAKAISGQSSDTPTPATSSALPPDQPQQAPAQPQPATAPAYTPTPQLEGYQAASKAIDYLSQFPASERSKIWNTGVRQTFAQKFGVPEERLDAIDNVLKLPDEQGSDSALQVMKHIFDTAAHEHAIATGHPEAAAAGYAPPPQGASTAPPQANVQPPSAGGGGVAPSSPPTNPPAQAAAPAAPVNGPGGQGNWGRRLLESPDALMQISKLKMAGLDLSNVQSAANELAAPGIAQEAAAPYEQKVVPAGNGATTQLPGDVAEAMQHLPPSLQRIVLDQYLKEGLGTQTTEQQAAATARGTGTQELTSIPITNPTTHEQKTYLAPRTSYIQDQAAGKLAPGVGETPTDMQAAANKADVDLMTGTRGNITNKTMEDHRRAIANATTGLTLLNSTDVNPNDLTPLAKRFAGGLNALGISAKDANNLALYQQAANTALIGHAHDFGGRNTDKDLAIEQSVVPSLTTPRDAAAFAFATQAAIANRALQWETFVTEHPQVTSHNQLLAMYNNGPNAASIYADPAFQKLTINGHKAVQIIPQVQKDGHVYGIFNGTERFLVK